MKKLLRKCGCGIKAHTIDDSWEENQLNILDELIDKYETMKLELDSDDVWWEYITNRGATNSELEVELNQLKNNREDSKISGTDDQSNQVREIIESRILELSLKIDKLCA
jgi:hypothetical protein